MQRDGFLLLVEDDPNDEALAIHALHALGIASQIRVARDGVEALEALFSDGTGPGGDHDGLPALVLLDLKLPKVDGIEVLQRIRAEQRTRLLPVVIFTSSREERDLVRTYELGANSFVQKPISFDEFAAAIRQIGLYWLSLNQAPPRPAEAPSGPLAA